MNERIAYNADSKRRLAYARRIRKAIEYKGDADHEDVPSILCEFQEEIIKEHTDKVVEQLEKHKVKGLDKSNPMSAWMNAGLNIAIGIVKGEVNHE